jgi:DNA primase
MGTALTEQQAALIHKYTKNVFLLYDSDQAGLKATFRSGDELLSIGVSARVITLPDGEDPDTFVAKHGAAGFERAADASVDVFDRKIQILERGGWFTDLRRKREALDKLLPTIRLTSDRLLRDLYIARTSEVAGVSREMLATELSAGSRSRPAPPDDEPPLDEPVPPRRSEQRPNRREHGVRAERELLRMLLHQRRYIEAVAERIGADAFTDPTYRALFTELVTREPDVSVGDLAAVLDTDTTGVLQELMNENGGLERAEETVEAGINALLSRDIVKRMAELDRLLPLAAADEKDDLIREKRRLAIDMQALGRPRWKSFNSTRS